MYLDISKAEVQLCIATKNMTEPSFTIDDLRKFGELAFRDKLEDWSKALQAFGQQNFIRADEGQYRLTELGKKYVERVVTSEFNGKMLLRKIRSVRGGSSDVFLEW
jgi:hypothetical protein